MNSFCHSSLLLSRSFFASVLLRSRFRRPLRSLCLTAAVCALLLAKPPCAVAQTTTLPSVVPAAAAAAPPVAPPAAAEDQRAEEQVPPKLETITTETLDQLKKKIEAATEIDEEAKKKVLETHQKAVDALARAVKLERKLHWIRRLLKV